MSLDVYLNENACPHCGRGSEVYTANITHNLGGMAREAGIYTYLWRPDELGIQRAGELVGPLRAGLMLLEARPEYYRKFDAPNGWGRYEHFLPFVREYLDACERYPEASVRVSL